MDRKYRLLGGPAENVSSPTNSQIEQNVWFISFTNSGSRALHTQFFELVNVKILKNIYIYILNVTFFRLCCVFLTIKSLKKLKLRMWGSGQFNSLQKYLCFSHLGQKLWEKMLFMFLVTKVQFFRGGDKCRGSHSTKNYYN